MMLLIDFSLIQKEEKEVERGRERERERENKLKENSMCSIILFCCEHAVAKIVTKGQVWFSMPFSKAVLEIT